MSKLQQDCKTNNPVIKSDLEEYSHKVIENDISWAGHFKMPIVFRPLDFNNTQSMRLSLLTKCFQTMPFIITLYHPQRHRFVVTAHQENYQPVDFKNLIDCHFNNKIKFFLRQFPIAVGDTSYKIGFELIKEIAQNNDTKIEHTMSAAIVVGVNVNPITGKPEKLPREEKQQMLQL